MNQLLSLGEGHWGRATLAVAGYPEPASTLWKPAGLFPCLFMVLKRRRCERGDASVPGPGGYANLAEQLSDQNINGDGASNDDRKHGRR